MKATSFTKLLPFLMLSSNAVLAQDYQSFTNLSYSQQDYANVDRESFDINSRYFFDKKTTLGPLNEFAYINTVSNVTAGFVNSSSESKIIYSDYNYDLEYNNLHINGELFINNFLVGAAYNHTAIDNNGDYDFDDNQNSYGLTLGYLISDNLLLKASAHKTENIDVYYQFSVSYNHQLNANDYIGFTYQTDDELEVHQLSSKYFISLGRDQYLTTHIHYQYVDIDALDDNDFWGVGANYYFNKNSSIFANYNDNDTYSMGAQHYFTDNYALAASYSGSTKGSIDYDLFNVNFTAQF